MWALRSACVLFYVLCYRKQLTVFKLLNSKLPSLRKSCLDAWQRAGSRSRVVVFAVLGVGASVLSPFAFAEGSAHVEARLQEVYTLISQANNRAALAKAEALVKEYPHFQLGQLVYADLLQAQYKPVAVLGSAPEAITRAAPGVLSELREESRLRVRALKHAIPAGKVPSAVLNAGVMHKHMIFVDSSRGRLYLYEVQKGVPRLVRDYYISVGRAGVSKQIEGDLRTPLGVYFVRSRLDGKKLDDLYGWGALPIDYPNPLDRRLGRTGSGIWLHGTPSAQYARAPQATEGCVAMANPDMREIMNMVSVRTTPVLIANSMEWVDYQPGQSAATPFATQWQQWRAAMNSGAMERALQFVDTADGKTLKRVRSQMRQRVKSKVGVFTSASAASFLQSTDKQGRDLVVVSYKLSDKAGRSGKARRQYWLRESGQSQWKIFDDRSM